MGIEPAKFKAIITGNGTTAAKSLRGTIIASAYLAPGSSTFGATVSIQKSLNDGESWLTLPRNEANDKATYNSEFSFVIQEPIEQVLYRFSVSNYTGNPIVVEFR